jgi:hypothetical protein
MLIEHFMTVREPFAHLLVSGLKSLENRSTPFPKNIKLPVWVAVHASPDFSEFLYEETFDEICEIDPEIFEPIYDTDIGEGRRFHGCSEIIGAVEIVGSVPYSQADFESENPDSPFAKFPAPDSRWAIPHSEWAAGPHCWVINRAIRFAVPIVTLGVLGVRVMPSGLQALVEATSKKTLSGPTDFYRRSVVHTLPKRLTERQKAFMQHG